MMRRTSTSTRQAGLRVRGAFHQP